MASVHRARGRKVWVAYYRDCNKKLIGRSTGVTNKAQAKIIAARYEDSSRKQKSLRQITRTLAEMYQLVGGVGQVELVTARDYVQRWLNHKEPEIAPASLKFYLSCTGKFLEFLGERAARPLIEITKNDIVNYRTWLSTKVSPQRTNGLLSAVRTIFADAVKEDLLADSPAQHVGSLARERQKPKRRAFSLPELQAVMAVADSEWQSLIRFGLFTGQRLSNLSHLRWSNLDLEASVIRMVAGKTGRTMIIPLAENLREHIASLPGEDPQDFLHPVAARSKQSTLSTSFGRILADAGLRPVNKSEKSQDSKGNRRKINALSFHSLRHTATSLLKEAGIPQAVVQELIGHDSEEVNAKYTHVGIAALKSAADTLPAI